MQVLKQEIREKILRAARAYFYQYDYQTASMRSIAQEAGISVSNVYKYFKNKEAIFEALVNRYYHLYLKEMQSFLNRNHGQRLGDEDHNKLITEVIFNSIKRDRITFILLMCKSKGTVYADFAEITADHFKTHLQDIVQGKIEDEFVLTLFARNFFSNIVEIARQYQSDEWAYDNIRMLVKYHTKGMEAIR